MAKIGDTVRFLNSTGGGVITRIEGQLAYVDDGGFETPVLLKEVVVVMPAGHGAGEKGPKVMFDQKAFDTGKAAPAESRKESKAEMPAAPDPEPQQPVEETQRGDVPNIALAFEPSDLKRLASSRFAAVLVNDSNYWLDFAFMRRAETDRAWTPVYAGSVAPNELIDIASLTHADLPGFERIALQCILHKKGKPFTLQPPVSVMRKLDLTKFHKLHCFRPGLYFENPVIELKLVDNGTVAKPLEVNAASLQDALASGNIDKGLAKNRPAKEKNRRDANPADNPRRVLPLIEVDLHICQLTDNLNGLEPKDMLEMQLEAVRRNMRENAARIGQKIVFIHGKGEGVLRQTVLDFLKKNYPKAELQDASFREYGFGATLVTIH